MQGLVSFATAIGDAIAVSLPALCYLAACWCFLSAAWGFRAFAYPHLNQHRHRPWVPFISLVLAGVFASFPHFITMANVSAGSSLTASLTSYAPTTVASGAGVMGATPSATVVNVVTLFASFFQAFGAFCLFLSVLRWRGVVSGAREGSLTACGVQFAFGVMCINIVQISTGIVALFAI